MSSKHLIRSILAAALALTSAAAVQASAITFEDPAEVPLFLDGDFFKQQGFDLAAQNDAEDGGFAGALVTGADCGSVKCPTNNASTYYAATNGGILRVRSDDGAAMRLWNLQASFLGANGEFLPGISGLLGVLAQRADGSSVFSRFLLDGPDANGALSFETFDQGDEIKASNGSVFDTGGFAQLFFFSYTCDLSGSCQAFSDNRAQFALDNVNIPEPSSWLLAGLGLGAAGFVSRRTRRPGSRKTAAA